MRKLIGFVFLLGLPGSFVAACAFSYVPPRLYSAGIDFRLLYPESDGARVHDRFRAALQHIPERATTRLASRVNLELSKAPDQFRITAIDADAVVSANTANALTVSVANALRSEHAEDGRRIAILDIADPPATPSIPNAERIMKDSMLVGIILSAIGSVLLTYSQRLTCKYQPDEF